jgi:hypothetical protein
LTYLRRYPAHHAENEQSAPDVGRITAGGRHGGDVLAVHRVIGREIGDPAGAHGIGDELRQRGVAQRRLVAAALQHADVVLGGADEPLRVAAGGDDLRGAVVGQDAIGIQVPEALEVGEVVVEAVGLGEIGDRVLQRVAGEQGAACPAARPRRRRRCGCRRG